MKYTVKDVAEMAHVSTAMVSRVMNGSGSVSEEKRDLIRSILRDLGSGAPHCRRKGHNRNIGLLLLPGSGSDASIILEKIKSTLLHLPDKWNLLLLSPQKHPADLEAEYMRGEFAGILLIGHNAEPGGFSPALKTIPHVWLNSHSSRSGGGAVLMGNDFAGRIAARHLMSRQCTRVGAVVSSSSNPGIPARIEGFCFEYFRNAPDVPCKVIDLELPEGKSLEEVTDDILEEAVEKKAEELGNFDGIFSVEDRLTALLYRVWNKKDMKIPETVSCNRMPEYLAGLYPRPASIDMSASTGAELGVGELLRRISGGKVKSDDVAVIATPQLVPGDF